MKTFLKSLCDGLNQNQIDSRFKDTIQILYQLNAVSKYKNSYYLNDGFVCGKLDINSNDTGFLIAFDTRFKQDPIIENKDLNSAHFGDIVLAKITKTKNNRAKAKVLAVLEMANETSVVYTKKFGSAILGVNIQNNLAISLKASQKSLKQLPLGSVLKINNLNNDITEVLGVLSDPKVDEKISLAIYNKKDEFPKACEIEASSWGDEVDINMYPNRINLSHLPFCTIDPVDAKDFDDAIYYDTNSNELYVAIADVSEYVHAFTQLDKEAKFRGFSIYFPHKSVPMLPRGLSENICSLKPNLMRLAFVFKISFDKNLAVIKEELFEAVIKSQMRFNYDEVDEILAQKTKTIPQIQKWILPLWENILKIRKNRLQKGFDFRSKELKMELDEQGEILSTSFESETPSHKLIEDCMLLANQAAAKRIKKGIFRNHAPADLKKINFLLDDLANLGIEAVYESNLSNLIAKIQKKADELNIREDVDKLIIKAQKRAEYSSISNGHFGLGFDFYTHFTSPIRRYSDLILHRLLKANLKNDDKLFNYLLVGIDETCAKLNILEREADKVAFDFMDRKFARFFANHINEIFDCYVSESGVNTVAKLDDKLKGAKIVLENYSLNLLEKIKVKIISSDIATAKITAKAIKNV